MYGEMEKVVTVYLKMPSWNLEEKENYEKSQLMSQARLKLGS
jgi:hypothetical protein